MKAESMSFFELLRRHAAEQPAAIASRSSQRSITYRRLWSRIERATARLLGEWRLRPGDILVYWGCGHQDALTLYLAAARCGMRLLPLEQPAVRQDAPAILAQYPPRLMLHDDDLIVDTALSVAATGNLSSLIATRCRHAPQLVEDDTAPSLMLLRRAADGSPHCSEHSLAGLNAMGGEAAASFRVTGALFDTAVLAGHVLPVLAARGTIVFR